MTNNFNADGVEENDPLTFEILIDKIRKSTELCGSRPTKVRLSVEKNIELLKSIPKAHFIPSEVVLKKGRAFVYECEIVVGKDQKFLKF